LLQRIFKMIREEWDPEFSFASPGPIPWAAAPSSLSETRLALVSTGGLHLRGDPPFRAHEVKLGDTSFRVIPHGSEPGKLALNAPYVDDKYLTRDLEVALPMKALDRLHADNHIGPPAARHYSFVGGIVRSYPGLADSAGRIRKMLVEDNAGAVILLPTCSLCVQTVCVVARELESQGFPTVAVSLIPELSEIVGAPRTLTVHFPFGAPCGNPGHGKLHRGVLLEVAEMLVDAKEPGEIRASQYAWRRAV
jgi:D-proline reductase (dithiol) PrdB